MVVGSDDVSLDDSAVTGSFDTKNAGTGKTVTITGLTLTGADAGKYTLVPPTTTANITAAPLTVTGITAGDKMYDGSTTATLDTTGATLTGVVGSDDVSVDASEAVGTFDDKNVGTGKTVTVTGLSLSGADAGNYAISSDPVTTTASITAATLTASGITAGDKAYDGSTTATLDSTGATLAGVVGSDDVSLDTSEAVGTFDDKNVGTGKTVTVTGLSLSGRGRG